MSAQLRPANHELLARRYFLVTDSAGYQTIKTSQEDLDAFADLWAAKYAHCLPLTVLELVPLETTA